jgi:hypothetical protein
MTKAAQAVKKAETTKDQKSDTVSMSKAQAKAIEDLTSVSARIRYLDSEGFTRSQITKMIPNASGNKLRYQHVRNVLVTPVAKKA